MNNHYGVFFGRFYPLNKGQIQAIIKAATNCDHLFVVLCDNEKLDNNDNQRYPINLSISKRYHYLTKEFANLDCISILTLNENDIDLYPIGFNTWILELMYIIKSTDIYLNKKLPIQFYCGESAYINDLRQFGEVNVYDIVNSLYPYKNDIIMSNPILYWNQIADACKKYFSLKILLAGTELSGKSTLKRMLAKWYDTSCNLDVYKKYVKENYSDKGELLELDDFLKMYIKQKESNDLALSKANRLCFLENDSINQQFYANLYLKERASIFNDFVEKEHYDLVLLVVPDILWENEDQNVSELRLDLHQQLKEEYESCGYQVIELFGTYDEKFNTAVQIIDAQLG